MTAPGSLLVRACRRQPVPRTPVWFMRQAGRYLEGYRALRARHDMLTLCRDPALAAEVTVQPLEILGVDAAILFSDLLIPAVPMGFDLAYVAGEGPVIHNPVRTAAAVDALRPVHAADDLAFLAETVRLVRRAAGAVPVVGFAGAPFTMATYLIEGRGSRHHGITKAFMYREPDAWHALLSRLADVAADVLALEIEAGAAAVQLFDTWVGQLAPEDYRAFVLPHTRRVIQRLRPLGVPVIHFGVATSGILDAMCDAGADVIGLDWRAALDREWERVGPGFAVQGNLDPLTLFAPRDVLRDRVHGILAQAGGRPGHIFNLGHGILPDTPVDHVRYVVDLVREYRAP